MAYLEVTNVAKTFVTPGGRTVRALCGVSFRIAKGQVLSIVGSNGAGKSSLLNCLRAAFPFDGQILLEGETLDPLRHRVVTVFQDVSQGVVGSMTALENLALVYSSEWPFLLSFPRAQYFSRIEENLDELGLAERFSAFDGIPVAELSGGQRQQVAIVMAMMRQPAVLLLDEFVANLDPVARREIVMWVQSWVRKKAVTALMVTHDHDLAEGWGDMVLELHDGECVRFSPAKGPATEGQR